MASTKLRTMVVLGSVRNGPTPWGGSKRLGDRVGKFLHNELKARSQHEIDYIDLAQHHFPLLVNPQHYYPPGSAPKELDSWNKRVVESDCYILITPEYNHSISPALSNFLDHFGPPSYACKPSLIAVYSAGPFGGVRAAMQMRAITGELGCISISPIFVAPVAEGSLTETGEPIGSNGNLLKQQATLCLNHLEWMADALKKQRGVLGLPKPK